nr:hypothetical protein [Luteolibacter ambystomatis]
MNSSPPSFSEVHFASHPPKLAGTPGISHSQSCEAFRTIDEAEAGELIRTPGWCAQEEFDGIRLRLRFSNGLVRAWNRLDRPVVIPTRLMLSTLVLGLECFLDGELVGDTFHAFDLLELAGGDLRMLPLRRRLDRLSDLLHGRDRWSIRQVPTARLRWEKEAMFETLRGKRRKGIVFKHLGCGSSVRKLSFRASLTCRSVGYAGNRHLRMEGWDDHERLLRCVVRIPGGHSLPPVGSAVEVGYREIIADGELIAPVFVRTREDVEKPGKLSLVNHSTAFGGRRSFFHGGRVLGTKRVISIFNAFDSKIISRSETPLTPRSI